MEQLQVLIKPASAMCNIQCKYCFYKDEVQHCETERRLKMKEDVMKAIIQKGLSCAESCTFMFQGGEPTLAGLTFFRAFVEEVKRLKRKEQKVFYSIQTNGVDLDAEWIDFFKENRFLVGISMDGVRKTHDLNRLDAKGKGTFGRVFENAVNMQKAGVELNILCVLNRQTAERIEAVYRFFVRKGFLYQQYIPCLDPLDGRRGQEEYSLTPAEHLKALQKLFDLWFEDRCKGIPIYIRQFDNYLNILSGGVPESCAMYGKCSMQNVIEADGSVYPCDFYALDEYRMGNIKETDFETLREEALKERPGSFFENPTGRDERCAACKWYPLCRGGCRRDCELEEKTWKNYYCEVYRQFFSYAISRLEWLAGPVRR